MDRKLFGLTEFKKGQFPSYPCPRCGSHLVLGESSEEEDAETRIHRLDYDFSPDWIKRTFRADLKCSSPNCAERVLCVGTGRVDDVDYEDDDGYRSEYEEIWVPTFFEPALKVFEIPIGAPDDVAASIRASFRLLYTSSGSALNEVRNAIEFLMDHLGVSRTHPDGKPMSLHGRVEKMPETHVQYKNQLKAVKWLGNAGTHAQPTRRKDVLDAFEILHHVLEGMFSDRAARLNKLADQINAQKAPVR